MLATRINPVRAAGVELEKRSYDRTVSWVYPDSKQYIHPSSISHAKPPHYNGSLSIPIRVRDDPEPEDRETGKFNGRCEEKAVADELNVALLVGAMSAEDSIKQYEIDVGISCVTSNPVVPPSCNLCRTITNDEITLGQERWAELVKTLTGDEPISTRSRSRDNTGSEGKSAISLSITTRHTARLIQETADPSSEFASDMTDSERSVDSDPLPPTPKPKKSYANVVVKHPSPSLSNSTPSLSVPTSFSTPTSTTPVKNGHFHFTSWALPPAATSPTPSPVYTNFSFPSLNSSIQSLPLNLTKDEQGFYTEITPLPSIPQASYSNRSTQRPPSAGLPSFLAEPSHRTRKTSKTREIVDQLRSSSANDFDRSHNKCTLPTRPLSTPYQMTSDKPSSEATATPDIEMQSSMIYNQTAAEDFEEEGDGWIRAEIGGGESDSDAKAQRTRVLVQALGRDRAESTQGSEADASHGLAGWEVVAEASNSSKTSITEYYGSWSRRKAPRHRSRKSQGRNHLNTSSFSAPALAPPPLSSLPPAQPYFPIPSYPAFTTPYPFTAYKPIQMSTQPHFFPAYAPPSLFGTITYSSRIQPPQSSPVVGAQCAYDSGNITGVSGMKHTQW